LTFEYDGNIDRSTILQLSRIFVVQSGVSAADIPVDDWETTMDGKDQEGGFVSDQERHLLDLHS
jgi:hypothetical protein